MLQCLVDIETQKYGIPHAQILAENFTNTVEFSVEAPLGWQVYMVQLDRQQLILPGIFRVSNQNPSLVGEEIRIRTEIWSKNVCFDKSDMLYKSIFTKLALAKIGRR